VRKGHPLREPNDPPRLAGFGSGRPLLRHMHEQAEQIFGFLCGQRPFANRVGPVPPRRVGLRLLGAGSNGPRVPLLQSAVKRAARGGHQRKSGACSIGCNKRADRQPSAPRGCYQGPPDDHRRAGGTTQNTSVGCLALALDIDQTYRARVRTETQARALPSCTDYWRARASAGAQAQVRDHGGVSARAKAREEARADERLDAILGGIKHRLPSRNRLI